MIIHIDLSQGRNKFCFYCKRFFEDIFQTSLHILHTCMCVYHYPYIFLYLPVYFFHIGIVVFWKHVSSDQMLPMNICYMYMCSQTVQSVLINFMVYQTLNRTRETMLVFRMRSRCMDNMVFNIIIQNMFMYSLLREHRFLQMLKGVVMVF